MRHLITLACLVAAFAAHTIGWGQGGTGFIVIGIILESMFWFRLLRKKETAIACCPPVKTCTTAQPQVVPGNLITTERSSMKNFIKDNRGFIVFFLCLGLFRTAIADWNPIPSGSMRPNLLEGDVVFVNRLAYDFKVPLTDIVVARIADPKRGDIVTFSSPKNGMRLIKRIVALPGDQVEMRNEILFVNGQAAEYSEHEILLEPRENGNDIEALRLTETIGQDKRRVQWLAGVPARNTFGPAKVPSGNFLMLGDNRDNSADSRYFGFVPRHLLIGQAQRILVSADIKGSWLPRPERFGMQLQ